MSLIEWVLVVAVVLQGVAFLMHVAKEPEDAHGKFRN